MQYYEHYLKKKLSRKTEYLAKKKQKKKNSGTLARILKLVQHRTRLVDTRTSHSCGLKLGEKQLCEVKGVQYVVGFHCVLDITMFQFVCEPSLQIRSSEYLSRLVGKPTMWFPNRSDKSRAVQAQKTARDWKFWI